MHLKRGPPIAASSIAAVALLVTPVLADSIAINFGPPQYHPASIAGQDGWSSAVNPAYDQAVVVNNALAPPGFGSQSFRMSNAVTSGSFGDWVSAKPLIHPAGDSSATVGAFPGGVRMTRFQVQWDFASTKPAWRPD